MSNRNFDSRVIIQRLQAQVNANNTYNYNINGRRIINNPQNSLASFERIADLNTGRETTYQQSLQGTYTSSISGILDTVISRLPQYPPPPISIITTDLIIHFEANDPSSYSGSGLTWTNIGTGAPLYNGTLSGNTKPVFTSSPIKTFTFTRNALTNGTDYQLYNYVSVPRPLTIGDDFTFCSWVNTTGVGNGTNHYQLMYIVSTETGNVSNDYGFGVNNAGQLTYGDGKTGGTDITISTTETVNTGTWTFVCVTRQKSNGQVNLYINGSLKKTGTCNVGNTLGDSSIMYIGTETDFPGYTWGGGIAAFLANTSVLTPTQILQNYNAQKANYGY